jgi:hypothetical protein
VIKALLESFGSAALGLTLGSEISDGTNEQLSLRGLPYQAADAWGMWHSESGVYRAAATYEREQSLRLHAHVLLISWSLEPGESYQGWWHCYPTRPRERIKGLGRRIDC